MLNHLIFLSKNHHLENKVDSKKNKKKIWILSIVTFVLIAAIITVGVIFGVQKKSNNKNGLTAENVSMTNTINEAIALGKVSKNYDGRYYFSGVRSVSFNNDLLEYQIPIVRNNIWKNFGGKNNNDLIYYLYQEKINELNGTKEILTFTSTDNYGKFTKQGTSLSVGSYVGDENLTLITLLGSNEQIFVSLNYNEIYNAHTINNTTISSVGTKLYLFERHYSKNNPNLLLAEVTYEYTKILNTNPPIPDSDLEPQ